MGSRSGPVPFPREWKLSKEDTSGRHQGNPYSATGPGQVGLSREDRRQHTGAVGERGDRRHHLALGCAGRQRRSDHGPTKAHTRCLLLEIYDGPHYFELPDFHSEDTVGRIADKDD